MIGIAPASSSRAAASSTRDSAVACASVCERVAREKSSNRRRRITVRVTRRAARSRLPIRSTSATSVASSASGVFGPRRPIAR